MLNSAEFENYKVKFLIDGVRKLLGNEKGKVMFVSFMGSYQVGKSFKIAKLLNSDKVIIGDGMKEGTKGVYIYGPISFKELYKRFQGKEPNEDCQIFFIDTEGSGGFLTGKSTEENKLLIAQIIAPHAALSSVIVTVSKLNITKPEVDLMEEMLQIFDICRSKGSDNDICYINIINDSLYEGDLQKYEEKKKEVIEAFQGKSDKIYKDVFLLAQPTLGKKFNQQNEFYEESFKRFGKELTEKLKDNLPNAFSDGSVAADVFENLTKITESQGLDKAAAEARRNAQVRYYERMYKENFDKNVKEAKEIIKNMYDAIFKIIKNSNYTCLPKSDGELNNLYSTCLSKLDKNEIYNITQSYGKSFECNMNEIIKINLLYIIPEQERKEVQNSDFFKQYLNNSQKEIQKSIQDTLNNIQEQIKTNKKNQIDIKFDSEIKKFYEEEIIRMKESPYFTIDNLLSNDRQSKIKLLFKNKIQELCDQYKFPQNEINKSDKINGILLDLNRKAFGICSARVRNIYEIDHCDPNKLNKEEIKNVEIKKGTIKIPDDAFNDCSKLEFVCIPKSVTEIGFSAFKGCSSLPMIFIPDTVKKIGQCAFYGCTSLSKITIPETITEFCYLEFGEGVFYECNSLKEFTIPKQIHEIKMNFFWKCSSLTNIKIPNNIKEIGSAAFGGCSSLKEVNIPTSVKKIGGLSFCGCTSLEKIEIPNEIQKIEGMTFTGCKCLQEIKIPNSVKEICKSAFRYCNSLKKITIPNNVTNIGDSAFRDCSSLNKITIPDSVKKIEDSAFRGCMSLTSIKLPKNITEIPSNAFRRCTSLIKIENFNNIISIGDKAFRECIALTNITFSPRIETIDEGAFSKCIMLGNIIIPNSIFKIGKDAFKSCTFKKVTVPKTLSDPTCNEAFDNDVEINKV